jgi:hypothetical protein
MDAEKPRGRPERILSQDVIRMETGARRVSEDASSGLEMSETEKELKRMLAKQLFGAPRCGEVSLYATNLMKERSLALGAIL